ncbi:MAG: phosphoenolpyruvate carboxykinase (ATP), partial [Staphylococcus simulans]|nr:phosphoenolpyruvate carboxykinase (ATP) [Staphylococcus simulans]
AIKGDLKDAAFEKDEAFGLSIPTEIEDVPNSILQPINAWSDKDAYREQADDLKSRFVENFKKFGEENDEIAEKGGFQA